MIITIPRGDGDIVIKVDNNDEVSAAARIIQALRLDPPGADASELERADYEKVTGMDPPPRSGKIYDWTAGDEDRAADAVKLSPALQEVYEYLRDNDQPEGVSPTILAEAFGLKVSAMDQRLRQLKKKGHAKPIDRGLWRVS